MSVINFKCTPEQREYIKQTCWEIIRDHYLDTVHPNTRVQYDDEGREVYSARLDKLMESDLCEVEETEEGIAFTFDSTEDAGFMIGDDVYHTGMGYSDDGLIYLQPLFDALIEKMPDITFETDCDCSDKWTCTEYHCSYDGETFESDDDGSAWE